ncbi:methionine--tRNA ligase [Ktedonosporobacter rubrisoli]|nr:methionine--tRNA ligase [Ktedonosporobacter rubrisoli]
MFARDEERSGVHRRRHYYITTAIDYPNGPPHIGHALEKIIADVVARSHRLRGDDTYFSMGLDENSQHVLRAAQERNVEPRAWIDAMDEAFRLAWAKLEISNDHWIRTTNEQHFRASQEMLRRAQENGDVYKAVYAGWYCPSGNNFYTSEELVDGHCPDHPTVVPEWLEEENYFFALSKYSQRLLEYIEAHPDFIMPAARRAEVVAMIRQGLRDFSVSRQLRPGQQRWGVPFPGDPRQVIYVWFDALTNYLTAVGFPDDTDKFSHYWPANAHVIGKDITRFHCLYWPAMLMSAGLPLPEQVAVHGFITLEGQRISKSAGNIIDPVELVDKIGADAVRYYLLRNLSFSQDGDFSRAGLLRHYNDELGNDLGNLLNRVVSMIKRYRKGLIPVPSAAGELEESLRQATEALPGRVIASLDNWELGAALSSIWSVVRRTNQYIEQREPWKLAREPEKAELLDSVLYSAAEATRLLALYLAPYIPASSARIMAQLGLEPVTPGAWAYEGKWGNRKLERVVPGALIFPRIEMQDAAEL